MPNLKVAVSGAGIAGNALAFWLSKLKYDVTVIERFPKLRASGLQIDLRGEGIELLRRMGLEKQFQSKAVKELGAQLVDCDGQRWGYFPANKTGKGPQSFTSEYEIMRGDLCSLIYDATKDRVKYMFGASIESFEDKDGSLEVRLSNGETGHFDLLVGADGQGSRTRGMMLGPDAEDPWQALDECVAYFTVPRPAAEGEEFLATAYMATGGRSLLTRRHSPDRLQVYLNGQTVSERLKDVEKGNVELEKKVLAETFEGAGWQADELIDLMMETDDFYCERQGLVKMKCWHKERVALIGDAAHCLSAEAGMGSSCAMAGAYILAGEIGSHCGKAGPQCNISQEAISSAFESYDTKYRPFIEKVQKGVGDPSIFDNIRWTPLTLGIVHRLAWVLSFLRVDTFASIFVDNKSTGWEVPNYGHVFGTQDVD